MKLSEHRLWLCEILACQLYESSQRAGTGTAPPWELMDNAARDVWRARAAQLIDDQLHR